MFCGDESVLYRHPRRQNERKPTFSSVCSSNHPLSVCLIRSSSSKLIWRSSKSLTVATWKSFMIPKVAYITIGFHTSKNLRAESNLTQKILSDFEFHLDSYTHCLLVASKKNDTRLTGKILCKLIFSKQNGHVSFFPTIAQPPTIWNITSPLRCTKSSNPAY